MANKPENKKQRVHRFYKLLKAGISFEKLYPDLTYYDLWSLAHWYGFPIKDMVKRIKK